MKFVKGFPLTDISFLTTAKENGKEKGKKGRKEKEEALALDFPSKRRFLSPDTQSKRPVWGALIELFRFQPTRYPAMRLSSCSLRSLTI